MKTILLTSIALFMLFSSCKKEKMTPKSTSTTNPPPSGPNSFFLKKDGIAFHPGYLEVSDPFGYAVAVHAAESMQSNVNAYSLMINKSIPVGIYDYETMIDEYDCWFSYTGSGFDLYSINDGTFEIIQQDTVQDILKMKFQFEMENENGQTIQITEGQFAVFY